MRGRAGWVVVGWWCVVVVVVVVGGPNTIAIDILLIATSRWQISAGGIFRNRLGYIARRRSVAGWVQLRAQVLLTMICAQAPFWYYL